jgi:hypothetical protein
MHIHTNPRYKRTNIKIGVIFTSTMFLLNANGYKSDMPISGNYLKKPNIYTRSHSI